jgi:hypothetical protein
MRLIRGTGMPQINHEAPINHAISRAPTTKALLRDA